MPLIVVKTRRTRNVMIIDDFKESLLSDDNSCVAQLCRKKLILKLWLLSHCIAPSWTILCFHRALETLFVAIIPKADQTLFRSFLCFECCLQNFFWNKFPKSTTPARKFWRGSFWIWCFPRLDSECWTRGVFGPGRRALHLDRHDIGLKKNSQKLFSLQKLLSANICWRNFWRRFWRIFGTFLVHFWCIFGAIFGAFSAPSPTKLDLSSSSVRSLPSRELC